MTAHLRRIDHGNWHEYRFDEARWLGATTILNDGLPKPALMQYAANEAAQYAVEHFDDLRSMPLLKALDAIRYAHRRRTTTAAVRGTKLHEYGAAMVSGEAVEVPDEHVGPAKAYAKFLEDWRIEPIAVETPAANTQHRYACTADLWAKIGRRDGATALVEIKTGGEVWPEAALQLAAQRYCNLWQPDGPESESSEVPVVDLVYVAHILPDDVRMVPVIATPAEHRTFLYVQQVARWARSVKRDMNGNAERVLIGEGETA